MPARAWDGYRRFCPLARGLDVIGERWTLVIVHNLLGGPARFGQLKAGLPGIGTNVLSDRLRKLEQAGVIERTAASVGHGVEYALTDRGRALGPLMAEVRRWGADELLCPDAGPDEFDLSYEIPPDLNLDQTYLWIIDGAPITLTISGQTLALRSGRTREPDLTLTTSREFMRRWAAGETNWDSGIAAGEVAIDGDVHTWETMLVATNYPGRPPDLTKRLLDASGS
jgi:DNA-binding HxlR family transcriptional regulator